MAEAAAAAFEVANINIVTQLAAAVRMPPLMSGAAAAAAPDPSRPAVADLFSPAPRVFNPNAHGGLPASWHGALHAGMQGVIILMHANQRLPCEPSGLQSCPL
jgi:hypothetical protein